MKNYLETFMETEVPSPEENIAWLSGIIDGEGCLGLYKVKVKMRKVKNPIRQRKEREETKKYSFQTRIVIYNTNRKIIERCRGIINSIIGYKGVLYSEDKYKRMKEGNRKICYKLQIGKRGCKRLLEIIKLFGKKQQQILLLEAQQLISQHSSYHPKNWTRLEQIYLEMKRLNKRGRI